MLPVVSFGRAVACDHCLKPVPIYEEDGCYTSMGSIVMGARTEGNLLVIRFICPYCNEINEVADEIVLNNQGQGPDPLQGGGGVKRA